MQVQAPPQLLKPRNDQTKAGGAMLPALFFICGLVNVDVFVPPQLAGGRGVVCIDDSCCNCELPSAVPFVIFNPCMLHVVLPPRSAAEQFLCKCTQRSEDHGKYDAFKNQLHHGDFPLVDNSWKICYNAGVRRAKLRTLAGLPVEPFDDGFKNEVC